MNIIEAKMDYKDLVQLSYRDIQSISKARNVPANLKKDEMIQAIVLSYEDSSIVDHAIGRHAICSHDMMSPKMAPVTPHHSSRRIMTRSQMKTHTHRRSLEEIEASQVATISPTIASPHDDIDLEIGLGIQASTEKPVEGKSLSPEAILNINVAAIATIVQDTYIPSLKAIVQEIPSSLTAIAHNVQNTVEKLIDSNKLSLPSHTKNDSDDIHALSSFSSMSIDSYQPSPLMKISLFEDKNITNVNAITQRQMVQKQRATMKISSKKHIYFTSPDDAFKHKRFDDEDMEVGDDNKVHWTYEDYDRCSGHDGSAGGENHNPNISMSMSSSSNDDDKDEVNKAQSTKQLNKKKDSQVKHNDKVMRYWLSKAHPTTEPTMYM